MPQIRKRKKRYGSVHGRGRSNYIGKPWTPKKDQREPKAKKESVKGSFVVLAGVDARVVVDFKFVTITLSEPIEFDELLREDAEWYVFQHRGRSIGIRKKDVFVS